MTKNKWPLYTAILVAVVAVIAIPVAFMAGAWYQNRPQPAGPDLFASPTPVVLLFTPLPQQTGTDLPAVGAPPTEGALPTATPLPSATPLPTSTPLPSATPLPTNTALPSATIFVPTATKPAPTATPTQAIPCFAAQFLADVTIPSGYPMIPDTGFTKTWRVKNTGTCSWTKDHDLVFVSGTAMTNKNTVVALPGTVNSGETVEISVALKSPGKAGSYSGTWSLRDDKGIFYFGNTQKGLLSVSVQVFDFSPAIRYNFILNACKAVWKNSTTAVLPCLGDTTSKNGSITILGNPTLENRQENEPALWVRPDSNGNGKIGGSYPLYTVQDGDHFRAWVGCLKDSAGCSVTFELIARHTDGTSTLLGSWDETYDGSVTEIDIDLSAYAGQTIEFALRALVNGGQPEKANAFWFMPRIETN